MIIISGNICIFVPPSRGNGLRRGTTRERLKVEKGRLLLACKFDYRRAQSGETPLSFFYDK